MGEKKKQQLQFPVSAQLLHSLPACLPATSLSCEQTNHSAARSSLAFAEYGWTESVTQMIQKGLECPHHHGACL